MITSLLQTLGLYLGPEPTLLKPDDAEFNSTVEDNPPGYFEHKQFIHFNDELLEMLGGTFLDVPAIQSGWSAESRFIPLHNRVQGLASEFEGYDIWGWKDPRTTLTLEFWQSVYPDMKIIICLRNPLEIAKSLVNRNVESQPEAMDLIQRYYDALSLSYQKSPFLVTHYDVYFYKPKQELARIAEFLGLSPTRADYQAAISRISNELHRKNASNVLLEMEGTRAVNQHYQGFCSLAGPVFNKMQHDNAYQRKVLEQHLRQNYQELQEHIALQEQERSRFDERLSAEVSAVQQEEHAKYNEQLEETLEKAHADHDAQLAQLLNESSEKSRQLDELKQTHEQQLSDKDNQLAQALEKQKANHELKMEYIVTRADESLKAIGVELDALQAQLEASQLQVYAQQEKNQELASRLMRLESELDEIQKARQSYQSGNTETMALETQLELANLTAQVAMLQEELTNRDSEGGEKYSQFAAHSPRQDRWIVRTARAVYHALVPLNMRLAFRDFRRNFSKTPQ